MSSLSRVQTSNKPNIQNKKKWKNTPKKYLVRALHYLESKSNESPSVLLSVHSLYAYTYVHSVSHGLLILTALSASQIIPAQCHTVWYSSHEKKLMPIKGITESCKWWWWTWTNWIFLLTELRVCVSTCACLWARVCSRRIRSRMIKATTVTSKHQLEWISCRQGQSDWFVKIDLCVLHGTLPFTRNISNLLIWGLRKSHSIWSVWKIAFSTRTNLQHQNWEK